MFNQVYFEQDMTRQVHVRAMNGSLYEGDNEGLQVGVKIYRNGQPENLTGTILCETIRDDGAMILTDGAISENLAYANIKSNCLMPGCVRIVLKNLVGTQKTTVLAITGTVVMVNGSAYLDDNVIPDLTEYTALTERIEAAAEAIDGLSTSVELVAGDRYKCIVTKG